MGPTASGKTALAELLCTRLPCEVISVDSTAVYRGLDIGSAKPDAPLQARMPHRLIDIRHPDQPYSAADFVADAQLAITDIQQRGKHPLLVGGSMLYFKALRDGLADMPPANPEVRATIESLAEAQGWAAVHAELKRVDPVAAARIHPNDPQRLQRALEVYRTSGETLTALQEKQQTAGKRLATPPHQLAIYPAERALLHERIAVRFDQMLEQGLVDEVQQLLRAGVNTESPAMKSVGYRQVVQYLQGEYTYEQMRDRAIIASRQMAKRQMTWLRGWQGLHLLQAERADYVSKLQKAAVDDERSIFEQALAFCQQII